jgi:DnaJ-class molecular chaperone
MDKLTEIEVTCIRCNGSGTIVYGSGATWRGGIGGSMMTEDVCNKCWGSGDEKNPGENLKAKQ